MMIRAMTDDTAASIKYVTVCKRYHFTPILAKIVLLWYVNSDGSVLLSFQNMSSFLAYRNAD